MKKTFIYFLGLLSMAFLVASCNESTHEPGEPDVEGCYGVYFPAQDTDLSFNSYEDKTVTVTVARTNTEDAIQVPVEVTDTSGCFTVSELYFAAGDEYSSFEVTFDGLESNVSYYCMFQITDPLYASYYSTNAAVLDLTVIVENWESLGYGQWNDYFFMSDVILDVEVYKSGDVDSLYRVYNPWPTNVVLADWGDYMEVGDVPSYVDFTVNSDGSISWVGNTTYSSYAAIATGYTYVGYGEIYYLPTSAFSSYQDYTSYTDEEGYVFVINWVAYIPDYGGGFGMYTAYLALPDYTGDFEAYLDSQ